MVWPANTQLRLILRRPRQMRPLVVVNPDEVIEALLLLQEVEGGGFGGFIFECQMHALVATVLLGVAGLNALDLDTESQYSLLPSMNAPL